MYLSVMPSPGEESPEVLISYVLTWRRDPAVLISYVLTWRREPWGTYQLCPHLEKRALRYLSAMSSPGEESPEVLISYVLTWRRDPAVLISYVLTWRREPWGTYQLCPHLEKRTLRYLSAVSSRGEENPEVLISYVLTWRKKLWGTY